MVKMVRGMMIKVKMLILMVTITPVTIQVIVVRKIRMLIMTNDFIERE